MGRDLGGSVLRTPTQNKLSRGLRLCNSGLYPVLKTSPGSLINSLTVLTGRKLFPSDPLRAVLVSVCARSLLSPHHAPLQGSWPYFLYKLSVGTRKVETSLSSPQSLLFFQSSKLGFLREQVLQLPHILVALC